MIITTTNLMILRSTFNKFLLVVSKTRKLFCKITKKHTISQLSISGFGEISVTICKWQWNSNLLTRAKSLGNKFENHFWVHIEMNWSSNPGLKDKGNTEMHTAHIIDHWLIPPLVPSFVSICVHHLEEWID